MKTYIANGGDKITIEVGNKNADRLSPLATRRSKGIIKTRRAADYLPRRKKTGYINFYDLGKISGGGSIYKYYLPALINGTGDTIVFDKGAITGVDLETLESDILDDVFTRELSEYEKIAPGANAGKYVYAVYNEDAGEISESLFDSEKFTAQGLKITDLDSLKLYPSEPLFFRFAFPVQLSAPPSEVKITSIFSPSADPVSFAPSAKMDVFLCPATISNFSQIFYVNGFHNYTGGTSPVTDIIQESQFLNHMVSTFPREFLADYIEAFDEPDGAIAFYKFSQIFKSFSGARMRKAIRDFSETPPYPYSVNYTEGSPSEFPFSPVYSPTGIVSPSEYVYAQTTNPSVLFDAQTHGTRLIFIIRQNGNLFYFWQIPE